MIKILSSILMVLLLQSQCLAADMTAPVKAIMDIAQSRWSDTPGSVDYFDPGVLESHFSRAFQKAYHEAEKFPAFDDGSTTPFDDDVVTDSNNGCPLEDIVIGPATKLKSVTQIEVSFRLWGCNDDATKLGASQLAFTIITEDGKPVIDDIIRYRDGEEVSLRQDMVDIVKRK